MAGLQGAGAAGVVNDLAPLFTAGLQKRPHAKLKRAPEAEAMLCGSLKELLGRLMYMRTAYARRLFREFWGLRLLQP